MERRIDELGRIVIPAEHRDKLGIETKNFVSIELKGNSLLLKKAEPSCRLCGSSENINDKITVCAGCISKIKLL